MDMFGLTSDRVLARIQQNGARGSTPSLGRSIMIGSLGFLLASLCVFATVAFAEGWMYRSLGLSGAYVVWTVLFIFLGGALLSPLVIGPGRFGGSSLCSEWRFSCTRSVGWLRISRCEESPESWLVRF